MSKYIVTYLFVVLGTFSQLKANNCLDRLTNGDTLSIHQISLTVSPKHTQDFVNVSYNFAEKEAVEMNVENTKGEVFIAEILEANEKGRATIDLDVRDFPTGTYYIVIKTASDILKMEFTKD